MKSLSPGPRNIIPASVFCESIFKLSLAIRAISLQVKDAQTNLFHKQRVNISWLSVVVCSAAFAMLENDHRLMPGNHLDTTSKYLEFSSLNIDFYERRHIALWQTTVERFSAHHQFLDLPFLCIGPLAQSALRRCTLHIMKDRFADLIRNRCLPDINHRESFMHKLMQVWQRLVSNMPASRSKPYQFTEDSASIRANVDTMRIAL